MQPRAGGEEETEKVGRQGRTTADFPRVRVSSPVRSARPASCLGGVFFLWSFFLFSFSLPPLPFLSPDKITYLFCP